MKIMITDDAAFMRMMLKNIISKNFPNVEIIECVDGNDAISKYKECLPDLCTMDITMPNKDGIAALKEIKKIDATAKVVMCSAMGQQAMVVESIQAGAKDFIVKPFEENRVVETIKKQIA